MNHTTGTQTKNTHKGIKNFNGTLQVYIVEPVPDIYLTMNVIPTAIQLNPYRSTDLDTGKEREKKNELLVDNSGRFFNTTLATEF